MNNKIDLGNGLMLKYAFTNIGNGLDEDTYEIWDIDPVDDKPIFTGEYLDYDFVKKTLEDNSFKNACNILVKEIFPDW